LLLRVLTGLWSFVLVFLLLILPVSLIGSSSWGVWWGILLLLCRRWSISGLYLLNYFDVRFTLIHRFLRDTRHLYGSTGVFWFRRSLLRPCGLPVTGVWLSRAREVFSLCWAWWSRSASFRRATVVPRLRDADLLLGSFGGGACCTRASFPAMAVSLPTTWVDFLLDLFVYSLVSKYSLPICMAQILLKFSL